MPEARITRLTIFPIKSMKGNDLDSTELTSAGLARDRRFMVVRANGRFVTQRDLPRLALIRTALVEDGVRLSLESHGERTVPFTSRGGEPVSTKVWGDECQAVDEGEDVSRWLTSALQSENPLRLVRMAEGFVRPQGNPLELGEDTHTFFADAAPFLVANEASLEALNRELAERGLSQVPMNRFRPNIVVRGLEPFAEHGLAIMRSAGYGLNLCYPCERCVVTTIDQATAQKDSDWQPFRTLRDINPVPGKKPAPAFGQNAALEHGAGTRISVGDVLTAS